MKLTILEIQASAESIQAINSKCPKSPNLTQIEHKSHASNNY